MNRHVTEKNVTERQLCEAFLNNPGVKPETGKKLTYGKGPYNAYIAMCKKQNINTDSLKMSTKHVALSSQKGQISKTPVSVSNIKQVNLSRPNRSYYLLTELQKLQENDRIYQKSLIQNQCLFIKGH
jgi:hypothetical protein